MRSTHRIPVHRPIEDGVEPWLNLTQAASLVGVASKTLRLAAERGEIDALHPLADGPWLLRRTDLEQMAAQWSGMRTRSGRATPAGHGCEQANLFPSTT